MDAALNWYRAAFTGGSALAAADVAPVRVPTLFLWGDADATVGRPAAEATREFVASAYRFVVVRGAGHVLTDQAPAVVTSELLTHLAAHAAALGA